MIAHNRNPYGWVGQGPQVQALESELTNRFRPGQACAVVSSGTAALYLLAKILKLETVAIPTYACTALPNALRMANVNVTLSDVDPDTFNSSHGVVQHTYGVPADIKNYDIEDFTHAVGALLNGRVCGSMGPASIVSFGATKPLGIGQGGAVLGPPDLIQEIKSYRDYDGNLNAFNFQLSDVMAKMVRERLLGLGAENKWRFDTAVRYIASTPKGIRIQGETHSGSDMAVALDRAWYRFVLVFKREESAYLAQSFMTGMGIETIVPLRTDELLHRKMSLSPNLFPNAEGIAKTTLSIPIWPGMSDGTYGKFARH